MDIRDTLHPVIDRPHEYVLIYFAFANDINNYSNSYIEIHLHKDSLIKKLRFYQPVEISIDKGFNGNISGMEILDISQRQLDDIGIWVRNFEQDPSISFMAREVIEIT